MIHTILHMLLQLRPISPICNIRKLYSKCEAQSIQEMKKKIKQQLPKFLVQTICNCGRSFSSTISIGKIFLDSLEEGNRNLSTKSLNCNYTVCCGIQRLKLVLIYIKRNEDQRGKQNNKEFLLANHTFTVIKFLYCPT